MWRRLVPLVLVACGGVSQEAFDERYITAACELTVECAADGSGSTFFSFDSVEECEAFLTVFWNDAVANCEYDADAGADCLDELEALGCDDVAVTPAACMEVYTGPSCEFASTSTTYTYTYTSGT
jgi:hypothetical protein